MRSVREAFHLLLENWTLKLTAVFLALILWLVVRGDPGAERVITVPLEISVPTNMEIVNERPNSVDVTLRGSGGNMWLIQQISCSVDLRTASEGDHIVPLTPENIRLPQAAGLEIVGIRPARIAIDLERTISKQVPIAVATRGDPASGYDIYSKTSNPATVVVSGPRSHVEGIGEISTESVPLADQKNPVRTYVNLNVQDTMVHTVPSGPVAVDIGIGIRRKVVTVRRVPIVVDDPDVTIRPQWVSVQLLVPINYDRQIVAADLSATAEVQGLDMPGSEEKVKPQVRLNNPADSDVITIKEVQPLEVTARKARKS